MDRVKSSDIREWEIPKIGYLGLRRRKELNEHVSRIDNLVRREKRNIE